MHIQLLGLADGWNESMAEVSFGERKREMEEGDWKNGDDPKKYMGSEMFDRWAIE